MWFSRRRSSMQSVMEVHFWSLTRYRIGPRFLGLDYSGNIIHFRGYRKQRFGGWAAVTLGGQGSGSLFSAASNVLEDGYPLHYKASAKLQKFIATERKKWQDALEEEKRGGKNDRVKLGEELSVEDVYDQDQRFRDTLILKCTHPKFLSHTLRISPLATVLYKGLYFYVWLLVASLICQGYWMFRGWVSPSTRAGLHNLEEHASHLPRLLFVVLINGVAWLVRVAQPVIDPVMHGVAALIPQFDWAETPAENWAAKAENLARDTHPLAKERRKSEDMRRKMKERQARAFWMRILAAIVLILSLLCIL